MKKKKQISPLLAARIDAAMARAILAQTKAQVAMAEFHALKEQIRAMCMEAGLDWQMMVEGKIAITSDGRVLTKEELERLHAQPQPEQQPAK